jgi:hypothetical protein
MLPGPSEYPQEVYSPSESPEESLQPLTPYFARQYDRASNA